MALKGSGKQERINAQFSSMPATECIGAGRLEGWFATPAYIAEGRGWGHVQSYCFEGDLFFHLQRSPWLRGVNFQKKDEVTFEVVEVNGRCEAVKLLLPRQVEELEDKKQGGQGTDPSMPAPKDCVGQRVQGYVKSHYLLVRKQNWGFVSSDVFSGQVFWHTTENPDMVDIEFDRDDMVEFDVCLDEQRGSQVRAKNMRFLQKNDKPVVHPPMLSEKKRMKKEQWLKNWSATPPPDWDCSYCGWNNFGRNKTCNNRNSPNCPGQRPPREEWPSVQNVPASLVADDDHQAQKALTQQTFGAQAWGNSEPIPPAWQAGVQFLGQAAAAAEGQPEDVEDRPLRLLPFGRMPPDGNVQATMALCLGAFNDLISNQNPRASAQVTTERVTSLVGEVNAVLGEDRNAKHSFAMQLAKQPWFADNGLEVRYQPGKNLIAVSQSAQQWQDISRKRKMDDFAQ